MASQRVADEVYLSSKLQLFYLLYFAPLLYARIKEGAEEEGEASGGRS